MNTHPAQIVHSNGKLMLTGEYLVLKGALSLALPLRFGQDFSTELAEDNVLHWETRVQGTLWFQSIFSLTGFDVIETTNREVAERICKLLTAARLLNPAFLDQEPGLIVKTDIDFNMEWGMGSSSSLVSNIAYWAHCDPYELNRMVFQGSGYDIACARSNKPLIYKLTDDVPNVKQVDFNPQFADKLYFVWLNRKQNTRDGINTFDKTADYSAEIKLVDSITESVLKCRSLSGFQDLLFKHEQVIASILNVKTVQEHIFPDFSGAIKSLGAWGGDFILAATDLPLVETLDYFKQKGYNTVFRYDELVRRT